LIVSSIARRFGTGSAPGNARHTGHVCVFGPPPKPFRQRQNIFVFVFSWTWISRPITGSHVVTAAAPARVEADASQRVRTFNVLETAADRLQPDGQARLAHGIESWPGHVR